MVEPEATVTPETSVEGTEPTGEQEVEAPQTEPETAPEAESETESAIEDDGGDASEPEEVTEEREPEPSAASDRVMLGTVEGRVRHVATDVVYGILGNGAQRVDVLRGEPSTTAVEKRMLATDGRATPIVFTAGHDENELPSIIEGYEAIAAALNIGKETVPVILIAPGDVGEAQSHLVEMRRKQQTPETSEDDLYVIVAASDEDF